MSLGTLYVDLQADTGKFVSAMNQAAATTKSATDKMSGDISNFQKNAAKALDTSELSKNIQAIRVASAQLNASLATGTISKTGEASARQNIVNLAKQEVQLAEQKGLNDIKNLNYLRAATKEIQTQKAAMSSGVFAPFVDALKLRVGNLLPEGIAGDVALRAYEPVGKGLEEGAGALEGAFGGAAVAIAGVTAAVVALGAVGLETTHSMMELAESINNTAAATGLSTKQVQELNEIAREMGIDAGGLENSFSRLQGQLGQFALTGKASDQASQQFIRGVRDMGVSVTYASGEVRPINDVLADFYDQLQKIPDQAERSAIEIATLGQRGREIAEVFEEARREGVSYREMLSSIDASGNVMPDSQLAQLEEAKAKWDGLSRTVHGAVTMMKGDVADALTSWQGFLKESIRVQSLMIGGPVMMTSVGPVLDKAFPGKAGETSTSNANTQANILQLGQIEEANEQLADRVAILKAGGEEQLKLQQAEAAYAGAVKSGNAQLAAAYQTEIGNLKTVIALEAAKKTKEPGQFVPKTDTISDMVEKLKAQSTAEITLAGSIAETTAAEQMRTAASEGDAKILEQRTQLTDRLKTAQAELENAKKTKAGAAEVPKFNAEIAEIKSYIAELDAAAPEIRARYQEIALAKSALSAGQDLTIKETEGFAKQIGELEDMVAAYKAGGAAIASAEISSKLAGDKEKIDQLREAYAQLASQTPQDAEGLKQLSAAIDQASAAMEKHRAQLQEIQSLTIAESVAKETEAYKAQIPVLETLGAAHLKGQDAVREAEVQVKVQEFTEKNPGASPADIAAITEMYREQSRVAQETAIAEKAASYDVTLAYADQVRELQQIREELQAVGADTLLVDAAIKKAGEDEVNKWDSAAMSAGTFQEKMRAVANEIELEGENASAKFAESFKTSIDDLSGDLARFVVTGKGFFRQWMDQIAESTLKNSFQYGFSELFKLALGGPIAGMPGTSANAPGGTPGIVPGPLGLVGSILGLGGKGTGAPKGTAADPLFVTMAGAASALAPGASSSTGGPLGIASSFLPGLSGFSSSSAPKGTASDPVYVTTSGGSSGMAGGLGGLFAGGDNSDSSGGMGGGMGGAMGIFGSLADLGFFAAGGNPTPGDPAIIGEKGPELWIPDRPGSIIPLTRGAARSTRGGDVHNHYNNVTMNVSTPNADTFLKSSAQINADMREEMDRAFYRNR